MRINDANISWTETDDGIVVLDLGTSRYLAVNESGRILWKCLMADTTASDLADALLSSYDDIDRPNAEADVKEFLDLLRERGMLMES